MTGQTLRLPRAVLFDWDRTLVDNWDAIHDAFNATLIAMGMAPWTRAQSESGIRNSMRESFPKLFGTRWRDARKIYYDAFLARHLDALRAMPGAEELLDLLAARGCYLGVVSNKQGQYLRAEARHLGWESRFARLVGASDAARDKPAVEPVELALEGAPVKRGREVWFVGDNELDMECAVRAGCVPILLSPGALEPALYIAGLPEWHGPDCAQLLATVRRL